MTRIKNQSATPVALQGSTRVQTLTQADVSDGDLTFAGVIQYVEIVNTDDTNAGVFTVNGQTIPVPPRTAVGPERVAGTASAVVSVTGATTYIVVNRT
jgi:hypothetical protein